MAASMSVIRRLHPWMSSMDGIHGWHFHPWMTFLHPWMTSMDGISPSMDDTSPSMDDISPSMDDIHGWHFSIHRWHLSIHGWHFSIHGWHPRMTLLNPWMAFSSVWFLVKIVCITLFKWEFLSNYCNSSEKLIVESSMAYVLGAGEMSSVDVIHGWRNVIHGWIDAIHWGRNVIRGCHPWMERCHPWMEKCHPWMEKCHPWMEKCHPWMEVSSMDAIHGWHPWMKTTDDGHGRSQRKDKCWSCFIQVSKLKWLENGCWTTFSYSSFDMQNLYLQMHVICII